MSGFVSVGYVLQIGVGCMLLWSQLSVLNVLIRVQTPDFRHSEQKEKCSIPSWSRSRNEGNAPLQYNSKSCFRKSVRSKMQSKRVYLEFVRCAVSDQFNKEREELRTKGIWVKYYPLYNLKKHCAETIYTDYMSLYEGWHCDRYTFTFDPVTLLE